MKWLFASVAALKIRANMPNSADYFIYSEQF